MLVSRHLLRWIVVTVGVCLLFDFGRAVSQDAKPLIITGELTAQDPFDKVRTKSHCKVHELELKAGEGYIIDLKSKEFDTFLRLEDTAGKKVDENDDVSATDRNSRLVVAKANGSYRAVVISFDGGKTGKYTLDVRTASPDLVQEQLWLREALELSKQGLKLFQGEKVKDAAAVFAKALELYEKVYPNSKYPKGHASLATVKSNLARCYQELADYTKAEPLYKQALDIRRQVLGEKHPSFATSLNNLAVLYKSQGDSAKAEPLYKQALEIRRQVLGEKHPGFATSLNNLAELYRSQGDSVKAEPLHKQALDIRRQVPGEKHPDFATSLNNLAVLYDSQGDSAKAEPLYKQALDIRRQVLGEKHPDFATSLNNLAALYESQGNSAKAEPLFKQALDIRRQVLGEKHPGFATSLNNLAVLYKSQGDYAKAEPLYKQALDIRRQVLGEKHPDFATSLNNLAALYRTQGDYAKAEPLLKQSLEIRRQVLREKHPDFAGTLNNLAAIYRSQGDSAKAEPLYRQAVQIIRANLEESAPVQSERQQVVHREQGELYYHNYLRGTAKLPGSHGRAYDVVLSWKGAVTFRQRLARIARAELANNEAAKELFSQLEAVSRQIALWSGKTAVPKGMDLPKKLADLTAERESVEARLSAQTAAFRNLKQSQKLTTAELQKQLPEGTVLVDFVQYGKNLAAFVVREDQVVRVELGQTTSLQEAVDRFRETMKRPTSGMSEPARLLREKLLDPLEKHLAGAKLLLIAPDGPLHSLPFAALPGKNAEKYFIEEVAIAIIPVPQMLPELLAPRKDRPAAALPSMLALGDVDFDAVPGVVQKAEEVAWKRRRAGEKMSWPRLPGTKGELLAIEDAFTKAIPKGKLGILRDTHATEAEFRKQAPGFEFLHLATHGFFAPKEVKSALKSDDKDDINMRSAEDARQRFVGHHPGLLSGVVFAGANNPKDDDDGVLTALEVGELDLSKVELAVLSACETGLGEIAGGEGVLGLQRAFQIAGARSTITSLWKVDDEATRKLMERFYDNYWKKNMGTLESLREAQLWMLREGTQRGIVRLEQQGDSSRRTPPYYWAAFVLSGDWR